MAFWKYLLIIIGIVALPFLVYWLYKKLPPSVVKLIITLAIAAVIAFIIIWIGKAYDRPGSWNG